MLSPQQVLLLLVMLDAVLDGTLDLTSEQIAERLQKKANAPKPYGNKYVVKLISTVRQALGDIEVISSHFYKGNTKYSLRGDRIATRRETAELLKELRKAAANLGKVNRSEFIEQARQNAVLASLPVEDIEDRLAWAERASVGYVENVSADTIAPTERVMNELSYLSEVADK